MGKWKIVCFLSLLSILTYFSGKVALKGEEILRIHIIANSNNPKDQFVKYLVRDRVLKEYSQELKNLKGIKEIEKFIGNNLQDIEDLAGNVLIENGLAYGAHGELGNFDFPTRLYLDTVYPKGQYKALKIILGEGKGDNWWCVMFPPLCLVGEIEEKGVFAEPSGEIEDVEVEYEYFILNLLKKIIEFIKKIFS
ncbi:stage II sporulation protein R [Anaerobranca gottschalkii]|uniref:Stage II sporulation protein R n=1 Tax=Anaerobranca gottschalkii DSM 13577 TaxID=1120990 RepID=A0A1I0BLV0_9FIRM|nr:stage II sporulation protein R [Anaerobranca gottschalkii]SET07830.1 stage II sporulation protein R [Anaerobranca gottschalkii DSM 13577]